MIIKHTILPATIYILLSAVASSAQNPDTPNEITETRMLDGITVTATRVELDETVSAKQVTIIDREQVEKAAVHSVNELLDYAVGVDVRQRGGFGIQTDISINGGSFDQITILINGVNINNPQTGHLSGDFPVALSDIERVEIIEGPAARIFGSSAFLGAVNIITRPSNQNGATVGVSGGGYGLAGGRASISLSSGSVSHQISGGYDRADGATANSDFRIGRTFYQGAYDSSQTSVQWQFGFTDQAFGANTFYSAAYPDQYEQTRRYMAAVKARTKGRLALTPAIYWNRSSDHYQLVRGTSTGENFHMTDVYGAAINGTFTTLLGKTAIGIELRNEGVLSTNLGKPLEENQYVAVRGHSGIYYDKRDNRTNVSYYLEHNILLRDVTISMGVMANMNTALDHKFRLYPGVDLSYRPSRHWKLFASYGKSLRMPTFTDLYYKSPTQQGNTGLRPEELQSISIGARYRRPIWEVSAKAFLHKGKNMIDWVMYSADDIYHSANFKLDNMGFNASAALNLRGLFGKSCPLNKISVGYAYINQNRRDDRDVYKSNYALEYLRHKFVARLDHRVWRRLSASWALRWQDRMGGYIKYDDLHVSTGIVVPYEPYLLIDLKLSWSSERYEIYLEANNLLNREYYDFGNIPQPGIWIKAGASYRFSL